MTERGSAALDRSDSLLKIGGSQMVARPDGALELVFREMALPWPGQALLPRRIEGCVRLVPAARADSVIPLDEGGRHFWSPLIPVAQVEVDWNVFADRRWSGHAYHDSNWGLRPLQEDFLGWDWARGRTQEGAVILYDARLKQGGRRSLGFRLAGDGAMHPLIPGAQHALPRGFWGVAGGIACDGGHAPELLRALEDGPFYRRNLVSTRLGGRDQVMMQESLDCRRLANPLVRMMLPFRMPRRA